MRVYVLVNRIVLPEQLPLCGLPPSARLLLFEIHRFLAFTIPLRDLHKCFAGEELDVKLTVVVIGRVRTSLATIDEVLEILL